MRQKYYKDFDNKQLLNLLSTDEFFNLNKIERKDFYTQ